jgi:hypothetical protein
MSDFITQLMLAEKAAEDIYFAKVNCELIACLHKRMQAEKNASHPAVQASAETPRASTEAAAGDPANYQVLRKTGINS